MYWIQVYDVRLSSLMDQLVDCSKIIIMWGGETILCFVSAKSGCPPPVVDLICPLLKCAHSYLHGTFDYVKFNYINSAWGELLLSYSYSNNVKTNGTIKYIHLWYNGWLVITTFKVLFGLIRTYMYIGHIP